MLALRAVTSVTPRLESMLLTTEFAPAGESASNHIDERYRRIGMPSIRIDLDDGLLRSLNKVAPARKRKRAEFVRQALKDAIRRYEYEKIREAYLAQPDSAMDADDWANAEEWQE